jgi:hypothetical protein
VKFKVRSRMELIRKTPALFANGSSQHEQAMTQESLGGSPALVPTNRPVAPLDRRGSHIVRPLGRLLTA